MMGWFIRGLFTSPSCKHGWSGPLQCPMCRIEEDERYAQALRYAKDREDKYWEGRAAAKKILSKVRRAGRRRITRGPQRRKKAAPDLFEFECCKCGLLMRAFEPGSYLCARCMTQILVIKNF